MLFKLILFICFFITNIYSDIYLHNPRGSNNRQDEQGRERSSNNRVFNSQNNNRGGYNIGRMFYYVGSQLPVEWTNQHSCKNAISNCEIIIQYMCSDNLRDGTETGQIPPSNEKCANNDCNTDKRYGMHEDYNNLLTCRRRSRNKGLFIADQNVRDSAQSTRQNPNGGESGTECQEERDYYPYWHPTQWIDIAILTNDPSRCDYYQKESENVKSRWYCEVPTDYASIIPNNKQDCEDSRVKGVWKEKSSHGVAPPVCRETQFTRDNHLGNTYGGQPPVFNWTIPNNVNLHCALRIRYNISTNDYDRDSTDSNNNSNKPTEPANVNLYKKVNLSPDEAQKRGYQFKTNPEVKIFPDLDFKLKLAINTAQYGRVFEDRSHEFEIRARPSSLVDARIKNVNVRGKRGNIVQVYPAVEYDFVPNKLEISLNDYVHFQWTGSNNNPPNNAGEGVAGSDRNNIVLLTYKKYDKGINNPFDPLSVNGEYGCNYPAYIKNSSFLGLTQDALTRVAILKLDGSFGSSDTLDDAKPYYNLEPQQIKEAGVYHYMCTRNNNFSNRDQKAQIISFDKVIDGDTIGVNGGTISFLDGELIIPKGAVDDLSYIEIEVMTKEQLLKNTATKLVLNDDELVSKYVRITINGKYDNFKLPVTIKMKIAKDSSSYSNAIDSLNTYRMNNDYTLSTKLSAKYEAKSVTIESQQTGTFIIKNEKSYGVVIGAVIGSVLLVVIVVAIVIYLTRNPKYVNLLRQRARNTKRSFFNKL